MTAPIRSRNRSPPQPDVFRKAALSAVGLLVGSIAHAAEPPASGTDARIQKARDFEDLEVAVGADGAGPAAGQTAALPAARGSASALNPEITLIADFAAAYFSDDEPLQTGAHDPAETGFNLQQLELAAGAVVDPYFRFDANIVFGLFGVELEEAYGTTLELPWRLQARFGQFLTRFGRINATHPHSWDFVDQPIAIGRVFGAEGGRGLGVELSWLTPLAWYVELVTSAMQADGEATARSFYGSEDLGVESPSDLLYVAAIKQFFVLSSDWSLAWGLSGAFGPNSSGRSNRTDVYATDVYLKYRPISRGSHTMIALQTEWLYRRRQIPDELLHDVSSYSQLALRFAQRWGAAARWEYGSPAFDADGSTFENDPLDPDWTDSRHRLSANLTHSPTEFSRLRLQASRDLPGWREGIWALFLSVELVAGAHGAHSF